MAIADPNNKSCTSCPSFLKPQDTVTKFKKSVGSPLCGRYGNVLGRPGMKDGQGDKIAKHFAKNCDAYGEPLPVLPQERRLLVTLPDIDARDESKIAGDLKDACTSCAMCKNFVRDDIVADELGWTAGLCSAWGKLILPNQLVMEARNCDVRQFGTTRGSTNGLHLLPEFEDAFNLNADPVKAYFKSKNHFVDPREWETERDLTADDKESGIRAWRRIQDPEGTGNEVFLPIYSDHIFSDLEKSKIPQAGDDEHPELYVDHMGAVYAIAVAWTELDETPACWGDPGTGKTEIGRYLAWLMQLPFERISITGQTEIDELAGKMNYSPDKGTWFQYGRLPKAWTRPAVIIVDEPNVGQPEIWQFLRPLTDNSKQLVLDMNEGEHLKRHTDAYLMMAMNPAWDVRNVGTQQIGDADARRLFHVFFELPPRELEMEIIKNRVALDGWEIDEARLKAILDIADDIRGLCKDDTLPITWGIAQQIKVARASRWFDMLTAYRRAIADYMEPQAQAMLLDQVRSHIS